LWLVPLAAAWWLGATGAGVRRELRLLEAGRFPTEDYALVSLLRRLQDDPVLLGLRLRFSRLFTAAFLPLCLAALGQSLSWEGMVGAALLGWFIGAATEAAGGGMPARRMGRLRRGSGYNVWARLTQPWARLVKPLLGYRVARSGEARQPTLVMAESRATLLTSGGRLGREERRFLRRLLASTSILVADILTRWDKVDRLDVNTTPVDAMAQIHASGHSRLPVMRDGRVIGLVTAKDHLSRKGDPKGEEVTLHPLLRPVYFVRQEVTMQALLDELQEARVHLAVVLDRLGRYEGIVTMEDVLEEIVGELHDEREREAAQ
jgi:CBS domain-containing protein